MSAMRQLHAIVKERQADWRGDAADDRRVAQARSGAGDGTMSASQPDPAARRFALLFHSLRRRDSGAVRP